MYEWTGSINNANTLSIPTGYFNLKSIPARYLIIKNMIAIEKNGYSNRLILFLIRDKYEYFPWRYKKPDNKKNKGI